MSSIKNNVGEINNAQRAPCLSTGASISSHSGRFSAKTFMRRIFYAVMKTLVFLPRFDPRCFFQTSAVKSEVKRIMKTRFWRCSARKRGVIFNVKTALWIPPLASSLCVEGFRLASSVLAFGLIKSFVECGLLESLQLMRKWMESQLLCCIGMNQCLSRLV